jgi:hypothetical protein
MTGAAQRIFAVAAAIALAFGILTAPHLNSAFAQNEAEPEATPMEEPQAEPTEFTPVTAGEAERGVPAPSPQAATSPVTEGTPALSPTMAETATAAETPSPAETPSATPAPTETPAAAPSSAGRRTTISKESLRRGSSTPRKRITEPTSQIPNATPSGKSTPTATAPKAAKGTAIVPENSPFAGMNFGSQKGPTNIKSDSATLDYQNKAILFSGHVHAVQAGGDLTSDTLKVQYGKDFNDIKMTYADGNVRMSQGTRSIKANIS